MKQIDDDDPFRYQVSRNEIITVTVTPVGLAPLVVVDVDGSTPDVADEDTAPTFKFMANKPSGRTHFVLLDFSFPGAPATARYDVKLKGSADAAGTNFGFTVKRNDPINDPIIRFKVA